MNLLAEFEKLYTTGCDTTPIYKELAVRFGLDVEYVTDYILINRYAEDIEDEFEEVEEEEDF